MTVQAARPNVTVCIRSHQDGHTLELRGADDTVVRVEVNEPAVIRAAYGSFLNDVERVRRAWRDHAPLRTPAVGAALRALAGSGRVFLTRLLRDAKGSHEQLVGQLRACCPTWNRGTPVVPLVHVLSGPAEFIPWELLPLFDPWTTSPIEDTLGLHDACRAFPGFSAVVERQFGAPYGQSTCLSVVDESLPLRFVWHAEYPGARAELGFFRSRPAIRLEGPYPDNAPETAAASPAFVDQIADPGLGLDGSRLRHPDQVLHVSCHCVVRTAPGGADGTFEYHLADEEEQAVVVPVDDVMRDLLPAWQRSATKDAPQPLVFLNACSTGVHDPWSLRSILEPFRHNGNRGVIATAATLPDRLAERFSRRFYETLLTGARVGEALHVAKWRLLEDRRNPSGMLYSLHGSSELQVAPVPRSHRPPAAAGATGQSIGVGGNTL